MKSDLKLRLTADARADVRSILRYTAKQWGARQRDVYDAQLYDGMDRLLRHPELGEERSDLLDGCRALRVEYHIPFYRIAETSIVIGRVLHVRQEAASIVELL